MKNSDERAWLREYVQTGCEDSFSQLVDRHVAHVYSTALRRVSGERALAEDITQAVFLDLAKKASSLPTDVVLAGWLHRHTCFRASRAVRTEVRRRQRESVAAEMNEINQARTNLCSVRNKGLYAASGRQIGAGGILPAGFDRDAFRARSCEPNSRTAGWKPAARVAAYSREKSDKFVRNKVLYADFGILNCSGWQHPFPCRSA